MSTLIAAVAVSAGGARASGFLTFSGTQAKPGAVVIVQTGGRGALRGIPPGPSAVRVFLAPSNEADGITSPDDRRLIPLGYLRVDEEHNGSLRFIVPNVSPGDYTTFLCVYCGQSSPRRKVSPVGPFPGSFVVLGNGGGFPLLPVALAAGGVLALSGAVGWTVRRRRWVRQPLGA